LYESALVAEIASASAAETAGGSLADILVAQLTGRLRLAIASFDGSPHIEELFSEHLVQGRDIYQKYASLYDGQVVATIERVCRKQRLVLAQGNTASDFSRYIVMAINGTKSAYPAMQPVDAFLRDLEIMLRTLISGAVAAPSIKPSAAKKSARTKPGDRK
jgi:TetR/AcrR family acrAB operon transcriptional repressor